MRSAVARNLVAHRSGQGYRFALFLTEFNQTKEHHDDKLTDRGRVAGSRASVAALRWAARQAERTDSSLEVTISWEYPSHYDNELLYVETTDGAELARSTLASAVTEAGLTQAGAFSVCDRGAPSPGPGRRFGRCEPAGGGIAGARQVRWAVLRLIQPIRYRARRLPGGGRSGARNTASSGVLMTTIQAGTRIASRDEFERRDPGGFDHWRAARARRASHPSRCATSPLPIGGTPT